MMLHEADDRTMQKQEDELDPEPLITLVDGGCTEMSKTHRRSQPG